MYITNTAVNFRPYQPGDEAAIRVLHDRALKAAGFFAIRYADKDLDSIQEEYLDRGGEFLVGVLNDEVVAMGAFRAGSSSDVAELKRMRVEPTLQGQGIGAQLLELLESKAQDRGYKTMILDTVEGSAGQQLYLRHGYQETRREHSDVAERVFYTKQL
jgi:GNAT superfamily N-acetyltransferase